MAGSASSRMASMMSRRNPTASANACDAGSTASSSQTASPHMIERSASRPISSRASTTADAVASTPVLRCGEHLDVDEPGVVAQRQLRRSAGDRGAVGVPREQHHLVHVLVRTHADALLQAPCRAGRWRGRRPACRRRGRPQRSRRRRCRRVRSWSRPDVRQRVGHEFRATCPKRRGIRQNEASRPGSTRSSPLHDRTTRPLRRTPRAGRADARPQCHQHHGGSSSRPASSGC